MFKCKVILVGDSGVGKTTMICRYVGHPFDGMTVSTSAAVFSTKTIDVGSGAVDLEIWDTAGQEVYRSLMGMYYRGAQAALLCFTKENVSSIKEWVSLVREYEPHCEIILVMTKSDLCELEDIEAVEREVAKIHQECGTKEFVVTSASSGVGIQIPFEIAAKCTPRVKRALELNEKTQAQSQCC